METPHSRAVRTVLFIEEELIFDAQRELGIDPLHDPYQEVFFVSVKYRSPYRPFHKQAQGHSDEIKGEWWEAFQAVMSWLRSEADPAAVGKRLRRMQKWEWGAIALDRSSLLAELESRYELGPCETESAWDRIPVGIVICCQILPRWAGE